MTKILITGAKGQLGSEINVVKEQYSDFEFLFTDIDELDITNRDAVSKFLSSEKPNYLINCAAYTAVDKAESDIETATLINAKAVEILASESAKIDCKIIHVSTDYVFDGNGENPYLETDETNPPSVYGKTKLEGEKVCITNNKESIIIRTSWLYSAFGNNFVKTMLRLSNERDELGVVADQNGSPTNAADLASAILTIISSVEKRSCEYIPGIYHYSNEGITTWYDFTKAIFDINNITCKVKPISTSEYPVPAPRPAYSVMDKSKIKRNFGIEIPHWMDSLKRYFQK